VIYGQVFFDETPDLATAIGAAIVILSGVYVVFREETPHVSRNRPVLQNQTRYVSGTYPRISSLRRLFHLSPRLGNAARAPTDDAG